MLELNQLASNTDLWPFILFLPKDKTRRHKFIKSIIASSVAQNIFSHFSEDGRVLQRDLIENLPHSNKSIIAYLKSLEEFQLSSSGTTTHNGKRVVYHELTKSYNDLLLILNEPPRVSRRHNYVRGLCYGETKQVFKRG